MDLDEIDFRASDKLHFDAVCGAVSLNGRDLAFSEYPNIDFATKSLEGKWEGYHLVKFATYSKNKIADDNALETAYKNRNWSIQGVSKLASQGGRKDPKRIEAIFESIADAQNISLFECFVDFLDFCSREKYLFSFCGYSQQTLEKTLADKKAYLKEKLSHIKNAFDGLHIYWDMPNNEHEQPVCKIEPCIGEKHLTRPYTKDNIDLDQPSTVLGWSSELTEFVGRENELTRLQEWLDSDSEKSIQFLSGDGGVGKTRLAFEFAKTAENQDWESGQATTDLKGRWKLGIKGILLIIDYPEERETTLKQFVRAVHEMDDIPKGKRLRIILLSRNAKFYDIIDEEAPRLLTKPISLTKFDNVELRWQLVKNTWRGLKKQHDIKLFTHSAPCIPLDAPISKENFESWVSEHAIHSTPLFIISLIYYLYCEPELTFTTKLTGQSIIRYMTKREIKFIRKEVSYYFNLKKSFSFSEVETLFMLKAISAIAVNIDCDFFKFIKSEIEQQSENIVLPRFDEIKGIKSIINENSVTPVTPDILASDFLAYSLENFAPSSSSMWIFIALGCTGKNIYSEEVSLISLQKLGRVIHDTEVTLSVGVNINRNSWNWPKAELALGLESMPIFCELICSNLIEIGDIKSLNFLLLRASVIVCHLKDNILENASALVDVGAFLVGSEQTELAKEQLQKAVAIYNTLNNSFDNNTRMSFARALSNLAECYYLLGEYEDASRVVTEAIKIKRTVVYEQPNNSNKKSLAITFSRQAKIFSSLKRTKDARKSIEQSINLYHQFKSDLDTNTLCRIADNFMTLAFILSKEKGESDDIINIHEGLIGIRQELAQFEPEKYSIDLADALYNFAFYLFSDDNYQKAFEACHKALFIFKKHIPSSSYAERENFAKCLILLSDCAYKLNYIELAVECLLKAINFYHDIDSKKNESQIEKVIYALNRIGFLLFYVRRCEEGYTYMEMAANLYAKHFKIPKRVVEFESLRLLFGHSVDFFQQGKIDTAIKAVEFLLKIYFSFDDFSLHSDIAKNVEHFVLQLKKVVAQERISEYDQRIDDLLLSVRHNVT